MSGNKWTTRTGNMNEHCVLGIPRKTPYSYDFRLLILFIVERTKKKKKKTPTIVDFGGGRRVDHFLLAVREDFGPMPIIILVVVVSMQ